MNNFSLPLYLSLVSRPFRVIYLHKPAARLSSHFHHLGGAQKGKARFHGAISIISPSRVVVAHQLRPLVALHRRLAV